MERVIPLAGESGGPRIRVHPEIPATGMERLWSPAVATSGNSGSRRGWRSPGGASDWPRMPNVLVAERRSGRPRAAAPAERHAFGRDVDERRASAVKAHRKRD